jgi:pyruvate kinase
MMVEIVVSETADRLLPERLLEELSRLRLSVQEQSTARLDKWLSTVERPAFEPGAVNLAHYLALRRHDLRRLQRALMPLGLSSLGRLEGRVLPSLQAVHAALAAICDVRGPDFPTSETFFEGERLLSAEAAALLGPVPRARGGRVMVTCGAEAATDPALLEACVAAGASLIRINCAHDSTDTWSAILAHARDAGVRHRRKVHILMDLCGPRSRTGAVKAPPERKRLAQGDRLRLVRPGSSLEFGGFAAECSLPEVLAAAGVGHRVILDEGKCSGVVETVETNGLVLRIERAPAGGRKLKPDKGLNFPDTELQLSPLTSRDLADLEFVAANADLIGYSFVQDAADVQRLQAELALRRPDDWRSLGLIAKIETPRAVRNLPDIVVAAAGRQPFGVMIARGDLAVELGFERLAEMQEEIAWLCEAANVPVIWATQVLESLLKHGLPSRSEMTDAAMAGRAECVMLNKGPYLPEAVGVLDRVLTRMAAHQRKKTPTLRALQSW